MHCMTTETFSFSINVGMLVCLLFNMETKINFALQDQIVVKFLLCLKLMFHLLNLSF